MKSATKPDALAIKQAPRYGSADKKPFWRGGQRSWDSWASYRAEGQAQTGERDGANAHRLQVKVQDVVHVGGQGCEQGVVGPVETHLRDDDGPQTDGQHHWYYGNWPAVSLTLKSKVSSGYRLLTEKRWAFQQKQEQRIQRLHAVFVSIKLAQTRHYLLINTRSLEEEKASFRKNRKWKQMKYM